MKKIFKKHKNFLIINELHYKNMKILIKITNEFDVVNLKTYDIALSVNDFDNFNKYGRVYRVYMQADSDYRANLSDLSKIYVKNNQGSMLPITSVITTKNIVGPYKLTRFNMYPAITINGTPANGVSSGKAMKEMEILSDENLPKDMSYAWSGVSLQEKNSAGQIGPILTMALTFVYLFLVALYESWTLPIAVLMISPIALLGALFFQYISGLALDIYAQVGLVMLIGLSTKQAILIVEFAKDAMEGAEALGYVEAAMQAAKLRFRAVMMTNIAFILGLLPLVFAHGAGAGSRHSIGVSVFGGMIAVAVLGSLLVPAFFVSVNVMKEKTSKYIQDLSIDETFIESKIIETYEPGEPEEIKDPELEKGEKKTEQNAYTGYYVELWKHVYVDGVEVECVLVDYGRSKYNAQAAKVRIGTKKVKDKDKNKDKDKKKESKTNTTNKR